METGGAPAHYFVVKSPIKVLQTTSVRWGEQRGNGTLIGWYEKVSCHPQDGFHFNRIGAREDKRAF